MNSQDSQPGEPYDVGYKKPPKQHQFQKGQSGNPKGRPKKPLKPDVPDDFQELFSSALLEKVTIKKAGKLQELTKNELLVHKLINDAISGSSNSTIQIVKLLDAMNIPQKAKERWDQKLEVLANQDIWTPEMEKRFQDIDKRFREFDDENTTDDQIDDEGPRGPGW